MLLRNKSAVILASLMATSAVQAQVDIESLAASSPNEFVAAVQSALAEKGAYSGPVDGQLSRATISAINEACRSTGVIASCQLGPLSSEGAKAVVAAVFGEAKPAAVNVEEEGTAVVWDEKSSRNGVEVSGKLTDNTFTATVSGTAVEASYTNLNSTTRLDAIEGQVWTLNLTATAEIFDGASATARIAAFGPEGHYIGELGDGARLTGDVTELSVSGAAPAGVAIISPYIQLRYEAGVVASGDLKIYKAVIERTP